MVQNYFTCICGAGTDTHAERQNVNHTSISSYTLHAITAKLHAASSCHSAKQLWYFTSFTAEQLSPMLLTCCSFCHGCAEHEAWTTQPGSLPFSCSHFTLAWQVFYIETISNPLLDIPDIPAVAAFCQQKGLTSVIDNTFASPAVFRSDLSLMNALRIFSQLCFAESVASVKMLCVCCAACTLHFAHGSAQMPR